MGPGGQRHETPTCERKKPAPYTAEGPPQGPAWTVSIGERPLTHSNQGHPGPVHSSCPWACPIQGTGEPRPPLPDPSGFDTGDPPGSTVMGEEARLPGGSLKTKPSPGAGVAQGASSTFCPGLPGGAREGGQEASHSSSPPHLPTGAAWRVPARLPFLQQMEETPQGAPVLGEPIT